VSADRPPGPAESEAYRRPTALERAAERFRGLLGAGPLRNAARSAYRAALELRTGGRGLRCTLPDGETVRILPAYRYVTWNPVELAAFRAALRPGDHALDVGANVGPYTLLFARCVGPSGRVLALEPAPEAFDGLTRHVALNGFADRVTPLNVAASDRAGTARLAVDGFQGTNHLVGGGSTESDRTTDGAASIEVRTVTVDELCERERIRPALLKVDVEGAEMAVLRGAAETIRRMGERLSLFVEMHPAAWRDAGVSVDDVRAEIAAMGLRAVPLRDTPDPWALEGECMRLVRA
jgi:FkbM family methyltransferase